MKLLKNSLPNIAKKQEGATMIEYAIMASLIAVIAILMVAGVGQNVNSIYSTANSAMANPG